MFSLLLLGLGISVLLIYRRESKPTTCFFEPELAKCKLMDQYMLIQTLPSENKKQALAQWQQECDLFHSQVDKFKKI